MDAATPELVEIPAGEIELRDARSGSSRIVALRAFELGVTPVTFAAYRAVMASEVSMESVPAHPVTWFEAVRWCNAASLNGGLRSAYEIDERHVAWDAAADGFRLPTEAEWEWACRAGTDGPTYGPLEEIAWTEVDGVEEAQDVGRKAPNAFGLYDTLGNVWEWCWDYSDAARYGDYRTLRGGGWADPAWSCRASVRRGSAPDAVLDDVGFRVARGPVGEPGSMAAQGWSANEDRKRADVRGPRPMGWTPLAL